MPASLRFPPMDENALRVRRSGRPAIHGRAARRAARIELDRKQSDFEALMHTMVTCGTLWGGFWFQFVIGFMYNCPALHTLSRGNWFVPYVGFYLPCRSPLSFSLAESFAWLSLLGALLALAGVWHWTLGASGKWRMRIMVGFFAGFLCLWSLAALKAEGAAWKALETRLIEVQSEMNRPLDEHWTQCLKNEKESIERTLDLRPKSE